MVQFGEKKGKYAENPKFEEFEIYSIRTKFDESHPRLCDCSYKRILP